MNKLNYEIEHLQSMVNGWKFNLQFVEDKGEARELKLYIKVFESAIEERKHGK